MYDVVIVGAGPAGLAAGVAARQLGAQVLIIEQGKPLSLRSHFDRADVISGIGGAGLYSDGKFSFYPSATALWSVRPTQVLSAGYKWLGEILSAEGLITPAFPDIQYLDTSLNGHLRRKEYPSYYLPADRRTRILLALVKELTGSLWTSCGVGSIEPRSGDHVVIRGDSGQSLAEARRVVLALGRLGALTLQRSLTSKELIFRRVELGIRIEQSADQFVFSGDRCLDPKLSGDKGNGCSWRTFCCCRNGLVVFSSSIGLSSVSGRADCPPTGRSNVGLLIRFVNASEGMAAWRDALRGQPLGEPVVEPVRRVIDRSGRLRPDSLIVETLGASTAWHLAQGLNDLTDFSGRTLEEASIYAPAIEGVGLYPCTGPDLKIPGRPIFVAGDVTGIFRGLTAALVSGFVAGFAAAESAIGRTV
jgi:uncharacterized protein